MQTSVTRAFLGFVAAALSVLTFHAAMWGALHALNLPGMGMPAPYPMGAVPPFGVPQIVSLCFWGGLYGAVFGLALPRLRAPLWLCGLGLGIIAVLVGFFVVPMFKGGPIGGGWVALNWVRSILINGFWGIGVGVILPILLRRAPRTA